MKSMTPIIPMFDWLVHSKTRLRVMKLFFRDPEEALYGLEISKTLKISPGTTHRELNAMLKQEIISRKKKKALIMYKLNTRHPYFYELKKAVFPGKKENRVLFVSDLHLNSETPEEMIEDFHLFLDYAEDNASEIVFVGDMVNMLAADVFKTYLIHKPLFDRVVQLSHDLKITYLAGNHDCFLQLLTSEDGQSSFFDARINFDREYVNSSLGIYATHGQQYDDFSEMKGFKTAKINSNGKELSELLMKIKREGYSMHQSRLLALADYADNALKFARYVTEKKIDYSSKFQKIAKELIDKQDYAYIVFGHTHHALLKNMGRGIYLNTGSWKSEKKRQFVEIDKEGGALVAIDDLK